MAHQEHSWKFLQEKHGKNIPYLEGSWGGGGTKSLNQKNLPHAVFEIPGSPCMLKSQSLQHEACCILLIQWLSGLWGVSKLFLGQKMGRSKKRIAA